MTVGLESAKVVTSSKFIIRIESVIMTYIFIDTR